MSMKRKVWSFCIVIAVLLVFFAVFIVVSLTNMQYADAGSVIFAVIAFAFVFVLLVLGFALYLSRSAFMPMGVLHECMSLTESKGIMRFPHEEWEIVDKNKKRA